MPPRVERIAVRVHLNRWASVPLPELREFRSYPSFFSASAARSFAAQATFIASTACFSYSLTASAARFFTASAAFIALWTRSFSSWTFFSFSFKIFMYCRLVVAGRKYSSAFTLRNLSSSCPVTMASPVKQSFFVYCLFSSLECTTNLDAVSSFPSTRTNTGITLPAY